MDYSYVGLVYISHFCLKESEATFKSRKITNNGMQLNVCIMNIFGYQLIKAI